MPCQTLARPAQAAAPPPAPSSPAALPLAPGAALGTWAPRALRISSPAIPFPVHPGLRRGAVRLDSLTWLIRFSEGRWCSPTAAETIHHKLSGVRRPRRAPRSAGGRGSGPRCQRPARGDPHPGPQPPELAALLGSRSLPRGAPPSAAIAAAPCLPLLPTPHEQQRRDDPGPTRPPGISRDPSQITPQSPSCQARGARAASGVRTRVPWGRLCCLVVCLLNVNFLPHVAVSLPSALCP